MLQDAQLDREIYIPLEKLDTYLTAPFVNMADYKNTPKSVHTDEMRYIQMMKNRKIEIDIYNSYHFNPDIYDDGEMQYQSDRLIYTDDYEGEFYSDDDDDDELDE